MKGALRKLFSAGKAVALSKAAGARTPLIVGHGITFRCNLSCGYCGIWKRPGPAEMPTARVFSAMEELAEAGCISWNLTGGEPFLRKDIDRVISKAKGLGMAVSLNTNGLLAGRHLAACRELDLLSVSIDGPEKIHDLMRGRGSFRKAIRGAILARDAGARTSLMSVISPANMARGCGGIRELIRLADGLGMQVAFQPMYGDRYNRMGGGDHVRLAARHPDYAQAISIIIAEKRRNPGLIRMSDPYLSELSGGRAPGCAAGRMFCYIFPDGRVAPCFVRERQAIDGRGGFAEAFRKLPLPPKGCSCCFNCYSEWSALLAPDLKSALHYARSYA